MQGSWTLAVTCEYKKFIIPDVTENTRGLMDSDDEHLCGTTEKILLLSCVDVFLLI